MLVFDTLYKKYSVSEYKLYLIKNKRFSHKNKIQNKKCIIVY